MSTSKFAKINFVFILFSLTSEIVIARLDDHTDSSISHHKLRSSSSSSSSSVPRSWNDEERVPQVPWRAKFSGVTLRNRTMTTKVTKRTSRFADFTEDDEWIPIADESAPFLAPMGGLQFPLFTPNIGPDFPGRGNARQRPPYPSLDYDRPGNPLLSPVGSVNDRQRFPAFLGGSFDGPKDGRGSLAPPSQIVPPPPQPPPVPAAQTPRYTAHGSSPQDRRYRPDRNKQSPYGPYGPTGPSGPMGPSGGKNRGSKGSSSGDNAYGPGDPFYDYDGGGGGPPTYSYNPSEIPRCAKESNVSYCIEDPEYPM